MGCVSSKEPAMAASDTLSVSLVGLGGAATQATAYVEKNCSAETLYSNCALALRADPKKLILFDFETGSKEIPRKGPLPPLSGGGIGGGVKLRYVEDTVPHF
mmetsp:Transcript_3344/g.6916  ORF Transcript_3344/g.6916 Transcript_3344/m.6916 type:complete len:102 (+) Transcript_3344:58-363(+)